ncbi:MAG: membrane protein insertase YidC [Burkholderiaceae bacterium]|jgi:YidC/Oxa1 family membrane protein insertase|nr:membrane protein insertase YidC [Burkholderiaceae bacterium]
MDTKKRTTLWIALAISLFLLWDNWQVYRGGTSIFLRRGVEAAKQAEKSALAVPVQVDEVPRGSGTLPSSASMGSKPATPRTVKAELVTVTTDLVSAQISTEGGVFRRLELLQHRDNEDGDKHMLLFQADKDLTYLAQTGLYGGAYPNHVTHFTVRPGPRTLGDADKLTLVMEAEQGGVRLVKTYTFHRNEYTVGIRQDVTNLTGESISPSLYFQLVRDESKPAGQSRFISTFTGPAVYSESEKFQKLKFDNIAEGKADFVTQADNGWVGMVQHYFVAAFIPQDKIVRDNFAKKLNDKLFAFGSIVPLGSVAPRATVTNETLLFAGPQESARLAKVAPGLELVKDYSWLTIVAKPIFSLMSFIYKEVGNWGWTIILLTLIIKVAFIPLSEASYRNMARMKQYMPKIKEMKDLYKDDKERLNKEMRAFYKAEKINPVGGCLPVVIQIPVFIALYYVLLASIEIRNAPWIGWIHDLATPDPYFILPALMAASMFLQQKMNPPPPDPVQAKMMMAMPIAFSISFFFFPSGLVLYWIVNNVLSILQQWWVALRYERGLRKHKPVKAG